MVSEGQQEANEERKRRAEENGDEVTEVRNSEGGIENLMVETRIGEESEIGGCVAEAAASPPGPPGGGGGGPKYPYEIMNIKDSHVRIKDIIERRYNKLRRYEPSLSEVIRDMDDSSWYKKAWSRAKAFFAGRSYEDVIIENKTKEIDAELAEKKARYKEVRAEYQKERDDLKRTDQEAKVLAMQYDRIVSRMEKKPDPMLAVQQKEVMDEIEYQNEVRGICEGNIRKYEPVFDSLGAGILALRKVKLHLEKTLEDFHSGKTRLQNYAIQKCRI